MSMASSDLKKQQYDSAVLKTAKILSDALNMKVLQSKKDRYISLGCLGGITLLLFMCVCCEMCSGKKYNRCKEKLLELEELK
jgi:hypothetical protein